MITTRRLEITISKPDSRLKPMNYDIPVSKFWSNGYALHRTDGPAVIYPGRVAYWYKNGEYEPRDNEWYIDVSKRTK
jgi:hypothetical protein